MCKIVTILSILFFLTKNVSAQLALHPDDRSDYVTAANNLFNKGNWEEGKKIVDKGLKKYPKYSDLKMLSGKYYAHFGKNDQARYELQKALEQNPNNVDAKQILVNVETQSKRYSSAICYVNELLEVNPYWVGLWQKKIELYRLQSNDVEADRLLKRITQIYPNDSSLHKDFVYRTELEATKQRKKGNIESAIALNSQLLNSSPKNLQYYTNLINDYINAGDAYNALAYTDRALIQFPGNLMLIRKKASLLSDQKRYNEALSFLQQQMKQGNYAALQQEYNTYLLDAARNAKGNETAILYGKILDHQPNNQEAFNYVFDNALSKQQYEEALSILKKYRNATSPSKELSLKELTIYQREGNSSKVSSLTKELFKKYSNDADLRFAYATMMMNEAKVFMSNEEYSSAINSWNDVCEYGDAEMAKTAKYAIYNCYIQMEDYNNALNILNEIIEAGSINPDDYVKRATCYIKQQRYSNAIDAYDHAISLSSIEQKAHYLGGYSDMMIPIVKNEMELYHFDEAMNYVERWLEQDSSNIIALNYAVNLSYSRANFFDMRKYAQRGLNLYPDNMFFKIKLAQLNGADSTNYAQVFSALSIELIANPYHKNLIDEYSDIGGKYGKQLIKQRRSEIAISVLDSVLRYDSNNKLIKYYKGLAYEQLHRYDSAFYYQSFYEPSLTELSDFKTHLAYLQSKTYKNIIGIYHLRSRLGDSYVINTVSTIEYTRLNGLNTYTGRINYSGRDSGKGYQIQGEWDREWNQKTRTEIDAAWSNKFFPNTALDANIYRLIPKNWELQGGIGYRRLSGNDNLYNLVIGATKQIEPWRLNARFNNFVLNKKWLYNLSADVRYFINSPKNYLIAVGSIGSSPDVDIINYQFYKGFAVLNTMVGAGGGYMLYKTVSVGILGTWYNYKYNSSSYKNLYNIYLQLNVLF